MTELPDLKQLIDSDKDALIQTLWDKLQKLQEKKPKKHQRIQVYSSPTYDRPFT